LLTVLIDSLVFVHGLGGDSIKTWTHADTNQIWISNPDFLLGLKDKVRVMTFGYNANVFENITTSRVVDHANDLLEELVVRRQDCEGRPLVFIAHSLGGLVVKRALLLCPDDDRYQDILKMASGIIFLGTPHLGSPHPSSLEIAQRLYSWATWSPAVSTNLTKELQTYSDTVVDINRSFMRKISETIELVCFFESVPTRLASLTKGADLIVPEASARIDGNRARNLQMACTHTELSKFAQPNDPRFRRLWDQLNIVVKNALRRAEELRDGERIGGSERDAQLEDQRLRDRFAQLGDEEVTRGAPS